VPTFLNVGPTFINVGPAFINVGPAFINVGPTFTVGLRLSQCGADLYGRPATSLNVGPTFTVGRRNFHKKDASPGAR
jgi:hypothetical protein